MRGPRHIPAVSVVLLAALGAEARSECKAVVRGRVRSQDTGQPVQGVGVHTDRAESTMTDKAGRFRLEKLCAGDVVLIFDHPKYDTQQQVVHVDDEALVSIQLTSGELIVVQGDPVRPESLSASTVLGQDQLADHAGDALGDTLEFVPGVALLRSGTGAPKPIIRGQFGRRLSLLVDGVRHESQKWGLDHAPEIDPFIAHKITVVRGADAVRYGPDAIGGVILVDPPPPHSEAGLTGRVQLSGTSNGKGGQGAMRLGWVTDALPGLAMSVEGSAKKLGGRQAPDYALDNTGVAEWNVGTTVSYRTGAFDGHATYRRYQAQLGNCTCVRNDSFQDFVEQLEIGVPQNVELYESDHEIERPYQDVAHDLAMARLRYDMSHAGSLTLTYAFQQNRRKEFDVVKRATEGPQFDFRLRTHSLDLEYKRPAQHFGDKWHLHGTLGLSGTLQDHDQGALPLVPNHDSRAIGVYAIERLLGHATELEAAIRYDYLNRDAIFLNRNFRRLLSSGQLSEDACDAPTGPGLDDRVACKTKRHALSASLGGMWSLLDGVRGKLTLSTASRFANPDEQYLNGSSPSFPVYGLGKPDLGVETTYGGNATVQVERTWLGLEASVYGNYIDDYIYFAPALDDAGGPIPEVTSRGAFPRFVTRPVDAVFYGAEAGATARPMAGLELSVQGSMVRAKDVKNDQFLVFVPPDRLRGELAYSLYDIAKLEETRFALTGTFVRRQSRVDPDADLAPPPDGYFLLGASLSARAELDNQIVRLGLEGKNLLNTRYRDYTSLLRYFADEPGWEVILRLGVDFNAE